MRMSECRTACDAVAAQAVRHSDMFIQLQVILCCCFCKASNMGSGEGEGGEVRSNGEYKVVDGRSQLHCVNVKFVIYQH